MWLVTRNDQELSWELKNDTTTDMKESYAYRALPGMPSIMLLNKGILWTYTQRSPHLWWTVSVICHCPVYLLWHKHTNTISSSPLVLYWTKQTRNHPACWLRLQCGITWCNLTATWTCSSCLPSWLVCKTSGWLSSNHLICPPRHQAFPLSAKLTRLFDAR